MKPASETVLVVVDHGLFLPVAAKIAEQVKHVYYHTPEEASFPTIKDGCIGDGFPNMTRISSVFDRKAKKEADGYAFLDIGYSEEQHELISQGIPVWGARDGASLEEMRGKFLKTIESLGMPVPKYKTIQGMTKLREHLRDRTDKFIKISKWRKDWETLHWRDWAHDEGELDYRSVKLGAMKEHFTFYVLDNIETEIEDGIDTYSVIGRLPKTCLHGMERKDNGYLGAVVPMDDISEVVRSVSEQFVPVLGQYDYRSFFSTEVRVKGSNGFYIDPTLRCPSPPSQLMSELYGNLADIVWSGANGELIEPEPVAKFGAQLLMTTKGDSCKWSVVEFPKELQQWAKCSNCCLDDGVIKSPPSDSGGSNDIGWLCAIGDTIQEVIELLNGYIGILPSGVDCDITPISHLLGEAKEMEERGMPFAEKIPDPSSIFDNE